MGHKGRQVLAHREIGKALAAFGHDGHAGAGDAVGGPAGNVLPGKHHAAGAQGQLAQQRAKQRGLAHAVAAQQGDDLAGLDAEVHAEQHLAGSVAALHGLHFEHHAPSFTSSSPR